MLWLSTSILLRFEVVMTAHQELRAWSLISLVGLALSGVIVIAVLAARVPIIFDFGLWSDAPTFRKALVGHVIFSFVVWFGEFHHD